MKRYLAPLIIGKRLANSSGELSEKDIVLLRRLYDGMSDEELLGEAAIEFSDDISMKGIRDVKQLFEKVLGISYWESMRRTDLQTEPKRFGEKNCDVALATFTDTSTFEDVKRLMWFLANQNAVHNSIDSGLIQQFDDLEAAVSQTADLAPLSRGKAEKRIWAVLMDE
ncbi:hypothetical protein [Haladaptatus sp. DYSN1]|uniref:hypothetical protein n=2 Tax=Haladaptatus TaxID=367188 RepID=UPI002405723C|nr:hypothetical protein [Haladaptatus sp. DYSN1]